jgi:hypothetical protein
VIFHSLLKPVLPAYL